MNIKKRIKAIEEHLAKIRYELGISDPFGNSEPFPDGYDDDTTVTWTEKLPDAPKKAK